VRAARSLLAEFMRLAIEHCRGDPYDMTERG